MWVTPDTVYVDNGSLCFSVLVRFILEVTHEVQCTKPASVICCWRLDDMHKVCSGITCNEL